MDEKTLEFYDDNAARLSCEYDSADVSQLHSLLRRALPVPGKVLEIGCGSGRDSIFMASLGCSVVATDGSERMLETARRNFTEAKMESVETFFAAFPLPAEHALFQEKFDAVVAVAVLMHIPDSELHVFANQVRVLLKENGAFICSFSSGGREESDGRLYTEHGPGEVKLLFERIGFRLLHRKTTKDGLGRQIAWTTLVFRAE